MDIHPILLAAETAVETAQHAESAGGVVGTLGLNWKLFVAQLVNFSVILFILWRWVFKPVAGALEARRQKIEQSVKKAGDIDRQQQELQARREQELKQARLEAETVLNKALAEAQNIKQHTIADTHTQTEKMLAEARVSMHAEKDQMFSELREEVANLTVMVAEKVLREKLDEKKDRKMIEEALKQIK
ncbi:MAG: ATP synthase F0 subunit B [Candidatus Magasanikbacteria bacterium RIFCSPHIGHO2_01_FULL_47_8]|uniref:ATP synthase subunit b n=1 Tax=Candidatus Magasanikbacteria bacterium RIFCSPHIGHO2_01_FULL_47_8 TaxID=1798673 RepID=A0A1F6MAM1_9BACT|nr:MAG: ATP synthase F0 subunit B [Candidatus Magasanikbacteria bacterium RIFCSPHIGHO2_01_FULL_47_8]